MDLSAVACHHSRILSGAPLDAYTLAVCINTLSAVHLLENGRKRWKDAGSGGRRPSSFGTIFRTAVNSEIVVSSSTVHDWRARSRRLGNFGATVAFAHSEGECKSGDRVDILVLRRPRQEVCVLTALLLVQFLY